MSAMEILAPIERRRSERHFPANTIQLTVARGTGFLMDISRTGLRARHSGVVSRGAHLRVTFEWEMERFDATAEVLASRVATLGAPTMFTTRLRFTTMSAGSQQLLERLLTAIRRAEL